MKAHGPVGNPDGTPQLHAICVGIDSYDDPTIEPLQYAVADAVALHALLNGACNYTSTRLLKNCPASQLIDAMDQAAARPQPGDTVLVYVAGHGIEISDEAQEGENHNQLLLFAGASRHVLKTTHKGVHDTLSLRSLLTKAEVEAPQLRWVFVIEACRQRMDPVAAPAPPIDPEGWAEYGVWFRDIRTVRSSPKVIPPARNWSVIASCGANQRSAEIDRLRRGALSYALEGVMRESALAGVRLHADRRFEFVLRERMDSTLKLLAPGLSQQIDADLAEPGPLIVRDLPEPQPIQAECKNCRTLATWLVILAAALLALLGVLLIKQEGHPCPAGTHCLPPPPPPPPQPQPQPQPPACTPAQTCPVCPSLPRCSPQSPTTIGPAKVCNTGGACGQAWLHVWNGDQQVFWKLGSEQHVERIVNGLTVQAGIEIASLWTVREIQGLWQADSLSRVVAVGLASQENDPRKPIEEQQRYEERRACIRAARLHDSLPAVVPPSKRFVMSLGQHQVSHRATDTAQQRPLVMVTVLNEPVGMDLDAELRRLMATHPGWRLAFDAYSQGGAGKALVSKVKDCGS